MKRRDFVLMSISGVLCSSLPNTVIASPDNGVGVPPTIAQCSAFNNIQTRYIANRLHKLIKGVYYRHVFGDSYEEGCEELAALNQQPCTLECNDAVSRRALFEAVTSVCDYFKSVKAIYDVKVICGEQNNPPEIIETGLPVVEVFWKPIRPPNVIHLCIGPEQAVRRHIRT